MITVHLSKKKRKEPPIYKQLDIPHIPPSMNVWERWSWHRRQSAKEEAYKAVCVAAASAGIERLKTPVFIRVEVYKKRGRRGDATNLIGPIDKLYIDAITEPRGRKRRGLGLIPDDTPEYLDGIGNPVVHLRAPENHTVLTFIHMEDRPYG